MTVSAAIGWAIVHSLWQGALAAVLMSAAMIVTRSARVRYSSGCALLLALATSFTCTLIHLLPDFGTSGITAWKPMLMPWRDVAGQVGRAEGFFDFDAFVRWLAPLWIVGVCAFYIRLGAGWIAVLRMRTQCNFPAPENWKTVVNRLAAEMRIRRTVELLESALAEVPVVIGHFRPVVLVPLGFLTGLAPDQVEMILLHEFAHISRWDYLANLCQRVVEGLLFYHPAVWWISRVVRRERENCCDDRVVQLRPDTSMYVQALTTLEQSRVEQRWPGREAALAATGGDLMRRVKRLLYPRLGGTEGVPALTALFVMVGLAVGVPVWHLHATPVQEKGTSSWQKWLNEDVVYIIDDQEKDAFERLTTDEERARFIEQFWERRNPTPGSTENKFKEEIYRRIAYANNHWVEGKPGWKSDRGRIYIKFGPPDEIDSHPAGGNYERPESEGGGTVVTYPFEQWRYSKFEDVGSLTVEFVDTDGSGHLRMTLDPKAKYKK